MKPVIGDKYLITTDNWFFAPDGESYRAVFGTVNGIYNDTETLGVKTNSKSTNWYLCIGNMLLAGCQIHYAVRTDRVSFDPGLREMEHDGQLVTCRQPNSRIFNADEVFKAA